MTTTTLGPLRKQEDVSKDSTAPTAVLPQGSSAPPTATTSHDTLAHCYIPHCTPGPSPYAYKRKVQGFRTRRLDTREKGPTRKSLALSHADACNPLLQAHPTWAQDNTKAAGFPFLCLSPLPPSCSVSRRPIWAGTRDDNLLVGLGTPRGRNADSWRAR
jgi:hypothetical protein